MTERIPELQQDISQLKNLLLEAERPNVQNYLAKHISQLKTQLDHLNTTKVSELPKPQPVKNKVEEPSLLNYTPLNKYGWEQEGSKVKLIFSLEGVGQQCSKEQVNVVFDKWSVEMKIKGYNKQNLIFAIKKLFGEINPGESKFLLKNNSIYIILIKKDSKHWDQMAYRESKFGGEQKEEAKDPSAGIMNMMKKMYDEGDGNMKRSIAEAWTKANDKKDKEKPDFSDRYDFLNK